MCHLQGHHGHGHAKSIVKLSNDERAGTLWLICDEGDEFFYVCFAKVGFYNTMMP